LIGVTVYQHHTHESIPWFDSETELMKLYGQEEVTMHVQYPRWYNIISNNAMEHTAHHIDPRVPLYNLAKAQKVLSKLLGNEMITVPFSVKGFLITMTRCKLYDYKNHYWLDFDGRPTGKQILTRHNVKIKYQHAA
jgi:omega-6 fatty acid desaturase (delta-12 desaturase)